MKNVFILLFTFISSLAFAQDNESNFKAASTKDENKNLPAGHVGVIEIKDTSHKPTASMFAKKKVQTVAVDSTKKANENPRKPLTKPTSSFTRKETY